MELFVFLDLDDTIFQTQRKCPPDSKITESGEPYFTAFLPSNPTSFRLLRRLRIGQVIQSTIFVQLFESP